MNRLPDLVNQRRTRRQVMDGRAWIVVWLLALLVVIGVGFASPASAQTDDPAPGTELGEDLYPPTEYSTDEDRGSSESAVTTSAAPTKVSSAMSAVSP